jgi:hypothetical protein
MAVNPAPNPSDEATWAWDALNAQVRHHLYEARMGLRRMVAHAEDPQLAALASACDQQIHEIHILTRRLYLNPAYNPQSNNDKATDGPNGQEGRK